MIKWKTILLNAVTEHSQGDSTGLDLIARALAESEQAKDILRKKGYGVTGTGIVQTALEVPAMDGFNE